MSQIVPDITNVTGTSAQLNINGLYIANNASLVTMTLPVNCPVGQKIEIVGQGAGGWRIAQNAGQIISNGASSSTTGVGGRIDSALASNCISLVCVVANTTWRVTYVVGSPTLT